MTKTGEKVNGFDVYSYTFETAPQNIIFNNNNNGSQTADLTFQAGKYFDIKAATWYNSLEEVPESDALSTDIYLAGSFNGWSATATEFKLTEEGGKTSVIKIELQAGTHEFKVVRNGTWTAPKTTTTISKSVTGLVFSSSGQANVTLNATKAGVYTFTWNDSKLDVTYPA